ncbi:unnamed protein product [Camellia sinensis]
MWLDEQKKLAKVSPESPEGTTFEGALDWLCLNLPGNELPLKFSTGTSLYSNEGGAVSIISTAREDWSPVVDSSDKNEEETPKISVRIKGRSDDDTLNSFQRSQADWIRQYVEQQEEDASESWEDDAVDKSRYSNWSRGITRFSTAVAFEEPITPPVKLFQERSRIMLRFADLLEKHSDHIAALETWDNGNRLQMKKYHWCGKW